MRLYCILCIHMQINKQPRWFSWDSAAEKSKAKKRWRPSGAFSILYIQLSTRGLIVQHLTPTLELSLGLFCLDSGHVVLLGHRLGQHALQPLQGGLALLGQRWQTLVTRVEGRDVAVTKLWGLKRTSQLLSQPSYICHPTFHGELRVWSLHSLV